MGLRPRGGAAVEVTERPMALTSVILLAVAVALLAYLLYALLRPEKF
jgi:K+-transporting ATPase KdpF subunit